MKVLFTLLFSFLFLNLNCYSQQKSFTFDQAELAGKSYQHLDSLYKSALHSQENLSVFKTEKERAALQVAYQSLIFDLSKFLKDNNFKWEKTTKCFNRIYFQKDGTIDYFLYNFSKGEISVEKEKEFSMLLEKFIKSKKIKIKAKEKFAQCSPIKYSDA